MLAHGPDGVGRGHETILEDAGEGALGDGAAADVGGSVEDTVLRCTEQIVAVVVDDGDAGKEGRAEGIDGDGGGCAGELERSTELLRSEGLVDGAVDLFADEAEDFGDAEIGLDDLRVGDATRPGCRRPDAA